MSGLTPAGRLIADEYFIQAYAGHAIDRTDADISPVYADLHDLPPTLMLVGTADVLLGDNMAMAARLSVAGNDIDLRIYPEAPHGFTSAATGMAKTALHDLEIWLRARYFPAIHRGHPQAGSRLPRQSAPHTPARRIPRATP